MTSAGFCGENCSGFPVDSAYCDAAWRGFSDFKELSKQYAEVIYHGNYDDQAIYALGDVFVWISAPDVSMDEIRAMVDAGSHLIVFDRSTRTLDWYNDLANVRLSDAAPVNDLPCINGNPELPVVDMADFAPALPESQDFGHWQIALNHPNPAMMVDSDRRIYAWRWPNDDADHGWIAVIRDESLPIQLMMNTLDNRRMMAEWLKFACSNRNDCRIHLFEAGHGRPAVKKLDETELAVAQMLSRLEKGFEALIERAKNMKDTMRMIEVLMLCIFLSAVLFIFYPFRRNRGL